MIAFHIHLSCITCFSTPNKFIFSITHALHFFIGLPACYHPPTLTSPTSPNTPLCPFHKSKPSQSFFFLNLTERSSTPHISATLLLHFGSCHLTPAAMYLSILWSHLCITSIRLLFNSHVSTPYSRADLMQASYTLLLVLHVAYSTLLYFTL